MGLFDKILKKSEDTGIEIGAVMAGECIALKEVPDEAFAQEMLGKGVAIIPSDGKVYAPADGTVSVVFPTLHAVAITTGDGVEILIHFGLDTVTLEGGPFTAHTEQGATVKKGDLLLEADVEQIKAAGLNPVTPVLVCNPDAFASLEGITGKTVSPGETVIKIKK